MSSQKKTDALLAAFLPANDSREPLPHFELLVIEGSGDTTVAIKAVNGKAYHYAFDNNFGAAEFRTQKRGAIVKVAGEVLVEPYARTQSDRVKIALRPCMGHSHLTVSVPEGSTVKVIRASADEAGTGNLSQELDGLRRQILERFRSLNPDLAAVLDGITGRRAERRPTSAGMGGLPTGLEAILGGLPPGAEVFTNFDDLMAAMGGNGNGQPTTERRQERPATGSPSRTV